MSVKNKLLHEKKLLKTHKFIKKDPWLELFRSSNLKNWHFQPLYLFCYSEVKSCGRIIQAPNFIHWSEMDFFRIKMLRNLFLLALTTVGQSFVLRTLDIWQVRPYLFKQLFLRIIWRKQTRQILTMPNYFQTISSILMLIYTRCEPQDTCSSCKSFISNFS
jgi:hypothetical protein